jgi:hypothetical protein
MLNSTEATRTLLERWREVAPRYEPVDESDDFDTWYRVNPEATDEKLAPVTLDQKYLVCGFLPSPIDDEEQAMHYAEVICAVHGASRGNPTRIQGLYIQLLTTLLDAYYQTQNFSHP